MKITRRGNRHRWWVGIELTCRTCGSQIELEESDMKEHLTYHESHPMEHGGDYWTFSCPVCDGAMSVRKSDAIEEDE